MALRGFSGCTHSPPLSSNDRQAQLSANKMLDLKKCPLGARPVLGNLTNKLEFTSRLRPACRNHNNNPKLNKNLLTATAVVAPASPVVERQPSTFKPTSPYIDTRFFTDIPSSYPTGLNSISQTDDDFGDNNTENCPPVLPFVCSSPTRGSVHPNFSRSPLSKRPRCNLQETAADLHNGMRSTSVPTVDDTEIDKRPFVPKFAYDVVRAAYANRVSLEELLSECRRADFAISALDRSPIDRMMEAADYIVGIIAYEQLREAKEDFRVGDFLTISKQPNLTADMLATLADWLIEVQEVFAFNHETIHLAWGLLYAYFDRGQPLARREIQLMACASIMVACKHEESKMPLLTEFQYITDGAYKKEEFIEMERRLLVAIDFAVHRPNPYVFLRRYARVLDAHTGAIQFMSRFLLEAGMHSHSINLMRESRKAAAVLWLARVVLRNPSYVNWTRRADVRQLRHFIHSSRAAQLYYDQCKSKKSTEPSSLTSLPCVSTDSEAATFSDTRLAEDVDHWIRGGYSSAHPLTMDLTVNETCIQTHAVSSAQVESPCATVDYRSSTTLIEESSTELSLSIKNDLEVIKSEEELRSPFWPPILEHLTGYKEAELIPLAMRYHTIALQLIAEVARGGCLAAEKGAVEVGPSVKGAGSFVTDAILNNDSTSLAEEEEDGDPASQIQQRSISPGGHCLRRQAVSKYCSNDFLNVADAYPQLAFENFVPYFPVIQCPDSCSCFICVNLIRRVS